MVRVFSRGVRRSLYCCSYDFLPWDILYGVTQTSALVGEYAPRMSPDPENVVS